jgi:predicted transcriptional regulator
MYNMTEDYLSTKEVAEILGVTTMTVSRYVKKGFFPGTKKNDPTTENSPFRIPRAAVEKFQESQVISPEKEVQP